jgi:hypothetical protein
MLLANGVRVRFVVVVALGGEFVSRSPEDPMGDHRDTKVLT